MQKHIYVCIYIYFFMFEAHDIIENASNMGPSYWQPFRSLKYPTFWLKVAQEPVAFIQRHEPRPVEGFVFAKVCAPCFLQGVATMLPY